MSSKQNLGLIGSIVLFAGVFMPIISLPIVGNLNYYMNGEGDGVVVLVLAGVSLLLVLTKNYKALWVTALGSVATMAYTFINFQLEMSQTRADMKSELAGNPFGGLAELAVQSIQVQWGWVVLAVGIGFLIAAVVKKEDA